MRTNPSLPGVAATVALVMASCGCVDGGWGYQITGRLIDAGNGQPLRAERVALSFDNPVTGTLARPDELRRTLVHATTNRDGSFSTVIGTGIIFGSCCPMTYSPPSAPPLTNLSVAPWGRRYGEQPIPPVEVVNNCRRTECQVDIGTVFVSLVEP